MALTQFGQVVDFNDLVGALTDIVVATRVCTADYVYQVLPRRNEDVRPQQFPSAGTFVTICGIQFKSVEGIVAGGGLLPLGTPFNPSEVPGLTGVTLECVIEVTLWTRVGLDQPGRDAQFVAHETLGVWGKWRALLGNGGSGSNLDARRGLHLSVPLVGGKPATVEPVRLTGFDFLERDPAEGWGAIRGRFETTYNQDLS